ncbi:hypothetical protein NKG94_16625 [Micromonospora sp. M12]
MDVQHQALSAGDGNTQVRAGVLRLLSTISAVSVKNSTTHGKATLTITAAPRCWRRGQRGADHRRQDRHAGQGRLHRAGPPQASTTYESSRVTKANL